LISLFAELAPRWLFDPTRSGNCNQELEAIAVLLEAPGSIERHGCWLTLHGRCIVRVNIADLSNFSDFGKTSAIFETTFLDGNSPAFSVAQPQIAKLLWMEKLAVLSDSSQNIFECMGLCADVF
jgi:hypothetical protein